MVSANNFTAGYAEALVLGTPKDQLAQPDKPKFKKGLSPEEIGRMEQEMESLEHDVKAVEESYGENMLNLTWLAVTLKNFSTTPKWSGF